MLGFCTFLWGLQTHCSKWCLVIKSASPELNCLGLNPSLLLMNWITLDKLLNLSVSQFPNLKIGMIIIVLTSKAVMRMKTVNICEMLRNRFWITVLKGCSYYYIWKWPLVLWLEQREMVSLSLFWTEFPWNAATCLNELHWPSSFSVPGWSRSVWWPGLPQMHSLSESPQSPLACVSIVDIFALGHFHVLLLFFFLNCLGPTRASFPKNTAHCFFFSCCSSSLFLPDSHNRMHCIVLIKRMNFLTLEKLQMRVGDLMLSGMHNALCPLKHLESHFR